MRPQGVNQRLTTSGGTGNLMGVLIQLPPRSVARVTASELDLVVEAKLQSMKDNCVLVNHLNTKPHQDRRNDARKTSNFLKAVVCSEARDELENIEDAIEAETATRKASTAAQKASTAVIKDLQSKKKLLKATSGDEAERRKAKKKKPFHMRMSSLGFQRDFGANSFDLDPVLEPAGFNRDNSVLGCLASLHA
ncbi:hypothetical protein C8R43DRAFT_944202 [Mycena crocata]|nr:hypothetical protein C8R43DRAFT_944202 [Mycena crocata]